MLYVSWTSEVEDDAVETIIPDGCRDIIVVKNEGVVEDLFLTDLDFQPRRVPVRPGLSLAGYRLKPGVEVNPADLKDLRHSSAFTEDDIGYLAKKNSEIAALLSRLAETGETIAHLAREAGVSERTLQRHFKAHGMPTPEFWRILGRARRAANALQSREPLADIALAHGYSDQAHMTRDFARWFGATPEKLRQQADMLEQIIQPGLGNWTGEQISIR